MQIVAFVVLIVIVAGANLLAQRIVPTLVSDEVERRVAYRMMVMASIVLGVGGLVAIALAFNL